MKGSTNVVYTICRLAKFRGLMYKVKYSAVIGLEIPIACMFIHTGHIQRNKSPDQPSINPKP
jgi:hypothetical protein